MKTSYEQFIDDYAVELKQAITEFNSLNKKAIQDNPEDLNKAIERVDGIYDKGVVDYFLDCFDERRELTITGLADLALKNMNNYGTEMRQVLNALVDFNHSLWLYLPDEEEEEDDFDELEKNWSRQ